MDIRILTGEDLCRFSQYLHREEKSENTIAKYMRDAERFRVYAAGRRVTKELVMGYKQHLLDRGYAVRSVNSMLASLNSLLCFLDWQDCRVRSVRAQRETYCSEGRELTREEYTRLLQAAEGQPRLQLMLKTICGTGIRVSELQYFTVQAAQQGEVTIRCKGKSRTILIPGQLRKLLLRYARRQHIHTGPIFITRTGRPVNRSNIWAQMKRLCAAAGVQPSKVFPHNLRKLFARAFYALEKDIAKLADVLGHSSIDTTRIYIMTTGAEHRRKIESLGLV